MHLHIAVAEWKRPFHNAHSGQTAGKLACLAWRFYLVYRGATCWPRSLWCIAAPIKPAAERCNIPVMTLWRRTRALGVVSSRAAGRRRRRGRGGRAAVAAAAAPAGSGAGTDAHARPLLAAGPTPPPPPQPPAEERARGGGGDDGADCPAHLLKLKAPTWTQAQLREAIQAVVSQKMRFTQAATRYGIPKGTLYDNILGKSKRMVVLEEAGLTAAEESAVLEFCCEVSLQPYNRRTKKSLRAILNFVEKLKRIREPDFSFSGLSGFRWWWAFCKKHSIVSLYFDPAYDEEA
ncbi:Uncharacterized protein GBIM_06042 [Gryllus bimaculatus]|nr:Uncharacterized protein GBIM_06042 [Gryllus bimaculatus]